MAAGLILLCLAWPALGQSDPVKGEATFSASDGYARLVFKFTEDVASEVTTAGSIVVIRFERPVDVPVDELAEAVPDYVSSVRRDPDGTAIRMSLARKVTINTMAAGERVFVDFLPETWSGPPPSLPLDVVRELAERARAAERLLRQQRAEAAAKKRPLIRVRALPQPTFVRFVFELPDKVGVSSVLNDQKLTLSFNSLLNFDLADAKLAAPPNVASIDQKVNGDRTSVEITLIGDVDVHSFREDKTYNIDVAFQQPDQAKADVQPAAEAARAKPQAKSSAAPAAPRTAARDSSPAPSPPEIVPPTSETIAQQMKTPQTAAEGKAEAATSPPSAPPLPVADAPEHQAASSAPPPSQRAPQEAHAAAPETPDKVVDKGTAEPAPAPSPAPPTARQGADATTAESVDAVRDSEGLRLTFSFSAPTPAASFRRGDTVWLVFDSAIPLDIEPIRAKGGAIIADVSRIPLETGQAIRIRLNRPQMHSLSSDPYAGGAKWTLSFADKVQAPPQPLMVLRNIIDPARASIAVPLSGPGKLHRIVDPDAGDTLLVVTAPPPIRGFIKRQDFVDLTLLDSVHGVAIRPNSEQVAVDVASDRIVIGKPGGLTLSPVDVTSERAPIAVRPIFDIDDWHKNQSGNFSERQNAVIAAIAASAPEQRWVARLELARLYMSRGMYAEVRGVTELILADPGPKMDEAVVLMVHAIASVLTGRPAEALKDLDTPSIGNNYDSQLWKALACAQQGKWAEAREKFKNVEFGIAALPIELQRILTAWAMRASLEVRDYAGASKYRAELEVVGVPTEMKPAISVLYGRLAEALAQDEDALDDYRFAIASSDRQAAAEARLRQIVLRQKRDEISRADTVRELETLAVTWRGDSTEVKTLQMLARIYSENGRYAESLAAARAATRLEPNSEISRQAQDEASALFSQIFLTSKGDNLPPIDALGMFYEFRELTPIGRRGDEMIRRLADRLVAVDLLDQAAELLQYQVDHRLEGAARAQVAAKLAMVYLTNRKPEKALAALASTRIADLSGELRAQRLLLEARAQSDTGRHDLALDIISNIGGREAIRLRSDIYWAARRWRESSEQIELYYGDRWRDFTPLNAVEKADIIRAVVGYALAEDKIGLARFREKYAPLMSGEADKRAFDIASKPAAGNSAEFAEIAKMAARVDTLDGFLREMKVRFPDATAWSPSSESKADPASTGALPQIEGVRRVSAAR